MFVYMQWTHAKANICSHFVASMSVCLIFSYNKVQSCKECYKMEEKTLLNREYTHEIYNSISHHSRVTYSAMQLHTEYTETHWRDVTCPDVLFSFQSRSQLELQLLLVLVRVEELLVTALQLGLQVLYLQEQQGQRFQ